MIALNRELAQVWPVLMERQDALPDADDWNGVADKLRFLER